MRRFISLAILFTFFVCAASLSAKDDQPKYKTAEVKHFTLAPGVSLPDKIDPQDFLNLAYDRLCEELGKANVAGQIVAEGAAVPDADAPDSIVVESKITDFQKAGSTMMHPGALSMEIIVYRRSDHTVITTIPQTIKMPPAGYRDDKTLANLTGGTAAHAIKKTLK